MTALETLTPEARRELIREGLDDIRPLVVAAYAARDWEYFGYGSWIDYLTGEFGGPLRLDRGERREAVAELRQQGASYRQIGQTLGVNEATVYRDSTVANATVEQPEYVIGDDGKKRQPTQPRVAHVSHNTGDNEWYTPPEYIDAARATMGTIDLDPATTPTANKIVQADHIFTEADNGLAQAWFGNVWMNPPYAQPAISEFSAKAVEAYLSGDITQACILVNNATETRWWQAMGRVATAICFPAGRIKFWHPDKTSTPLQGQAVIYFGDNTDQFDKQFANFGIVVRR